MNKSYTYSLLVLVLLAAAFVGVSAFVNKSEQTVTTVDSADNTAAVSQAVSGQSQTVVWNASAFPSAQVSINLIRKIGDNPVSYEFVRTISATASNTGTASWTPASNETGTGMFIEIGCVAPTSACRSSISPAI